MARRLDLTPVSDGHDLDAGAFAPEGRPRGTVLLLHGIPSVAPPEPGDKGYPGLALRFAERGFVAGWVDLRAVRKSPGFFSIEGWVRDARAALDALRRLDESHGSPVAVVGSSAGGAVAAEMARRGAPVDALVLLAAPARWVSFAGAPAAGVVRVTREAGMAVAPEVLEDPEEWAEEFARVATVDAISEVDSPVLVVHGTADDVVPVEHADEILATARRAEGMIVEGAGHQLRKNGPVVDSVLEWLIRNL